MNSVCRLLRWCMRNARNIVDSRAAILPSQFLRSAIKPKETVGEPEIKAILRCCYTDIEQTEARLAHMSLLLAGSTEGPQDEQIRQVIQELVDIGNGEIPSRAKILSVPRGWITLAQIDALGGLTYFNNCLYPNASDIFPYYLAILIQSSANPQALRLLKRTCIEPHAVRADLERIVWDKPRAASEQSVDFPKGRAWSAPNLVRRVCAINHGLVSTDRPGEEALVFLARGKKGKRGVPSWQTIHRCLVAFRERHGLANFQLRGLRRAGAKLHHAAGLSIRAAKVRLNHASEITTQGYTPASDLREEHEQTILKFQGVLVRESRRTSGAPGARAIGRRELDGEPMETVFGFGCKDPFAGLAPGSEPGRMCLQFFRCATCPGALIPVDDVCVVAKLLSAAEALRQARQRPIREGWTMRFEVMYGPVQAIIDQEIMPILSEAVVERARQLVDTNRLPWIE
ncbi:hypothetical protein [Paraburkholderia phymatum]|uniref:hypothetical protein n=1 Tax=Paraburkholderia phymatum TaxID=148447 RepID=UPI00319E71C8